MKLPRGNCPVCGADVALRAGGEMREHPDHRHHLYGTGRNDEVPKCSGSGHDLAGLHLSPALVARLKAQR